MAQETLSETGKRNHKNNGTKAADKSANPQSTGTQSTGEDVTEAGWEEQLWMDQTGVATDELSATSDPSPTMSELPSDLLDEPLYNTTDTTGMDTFKAQVSKMGEQAKSGLQSLLANQRLTGPSGVLNDDRNVEELKRWSSLIGGGLLALYGFRRSLGSLSLMGLGAGLVYYALTGQRPLPSVTKGIHIEGLSTGHPGNTSLDSNRPITVKNILVKAQLKDVYQAWADFENFPHFMQHIRSVSKTGERTSHWVMDGPLHSRLEWDAETTRLEENKRIAWNSTGGDIKTSGQVSFNALPDNYVEVTVMLRYVPPAGIVGDIFASLFTDPSGKLAEDLRNFKRYIEKTEPAAKESASQ